MEVMPLKIAAETLHNLEDNLALFFTGFTRSASEILKDQDTRSREGEQEMLRICISSSSSAARRRRRSSAAICGSLPN